MQLEFHPLALAFPSMTDEEYQSLKEHIEHNGQLQPIMLDRETGQIIDGRHRYLACQDLGLEPWTEVYTGQGSLLEYVIGLNDKRRHLTSSQRAAIAVELLPAFEEEAKKRQSLNGGNKRSDVEKVPPSINTRKARDDAAKALNTNPRYVQDAKKLKEQAPEKLEQVKRGEVTIKDAVKTLSKPEPVERQRKTSTVIRLSDWQSTADLPEVEPSTSSMNRVNENIEWAAFSWNPITGCLHNCPYCYARDIANRFYEQKFEPSFIPERLSQPSNTKAIEPRWNGDTGHNNIFTCSMADLFGKWVPSEWIEAVLDVVALNPQWNFLFLTKFPVRMAEFKYPPNVWLGTSVDRQYAVERAEKAFTKIKASGFQGICWLSCEPMLERLTFASLDMFDWVVMGGASKSSQTAEYLPPFEDIIHLHQQARESDCLIYQKTNLIPNMSDVQRIREYPR